VEVHPVERPSVQARRVYLVSNALEKHPRRLFSRDGHPILGLDKFVQRDLRALTTHPRVSYVVAPNALKKGDVWASGSTQHGAFDDDQATVQGTLARVLDSAVSKASFSFARSASSTREKRVEIWRQVDM
jgi:hypothetical protein